MARANATQSSLVTSLLVAPMIMAPTPRPSEMSGTICAAADVGAGQDVPRRAVGHGR
jgi:hypothetical protein